MCPKFLGKRAIAPVILSLAVSGFAAIEVATPATDADGCYLISNVNELYGFAAIVNGSNGNYKKPSSCGKLTADITVNKKVIETVADTVPYPSSFEPWTPLVDFAGNFDGDGHIISGLFYTSFPFSSAYAAYAGFIANTGEGEMQIKNLYIKDSFFGLYNTNRIRSDDAIGGIIGNVPATTNITISDCHLQARISGTYNVGGFIGRSSGSVKIENSSVSGRIEATNNVGGLFGYGDSRATLTVLSSHNSATIAADSSEYNDEAGGLVGYTLNDLTIAGSYNEGEIFAKSSVGGLVGGSSGTTNIETSFNRGDIHATGNAGGLAGSIAGNIVFKNCYNLGSVSGTKDNLGGILGIMQQKGTSIINCYSLGEVSGNTSSKGALVPNFSSRNITIKNSFYRFGSVNYLGGTEVSDYAIESGMLARLLHEYSADSVDGTVWGQNVGTDKYPVLSGVLKNVNEDVYHKLSFVTFDGDTTEYPERYLQGMTAEIPKIADESYVYAWYDNPEFTGKKYGNIPATAAEDLTLYARLIKIAEPPKDSEGCYLISDMESLYGFAAAVNGTNGFSKLQWVCAKMTADIVVNSKVLGADGAISADSANFFPWTPIGSVYAVIDGQGHTISGLYFNSPEETSAGLFGSAQGSFKDLGIVDSYFHAKYNVGGLVGYHSYSTLTISNCYNTSHIVAADRAGGLVGYTDDLTLISDSYNTGLVEGSKSGGLAGSVSSSSVTITNCYNTGTVRGLSAGGLFGTNDEFVSVSHSYNLGTVEGTFTSGGLVGNTYGNMNVQEFFNEGTIGSNDLAAKAESYYAGGIVGSAYIDNVVSIVNSYNTGDVNAGNHVAGGIVGSINARVNLTLINSYSAGKLTGKDSWIYKGGILGEYRSAADISVSNVFYLESDTSVIGGTAVSAEDVSGGALLANLRGYAKDDIFGTMWNQNVGTDAHPLLKGVAYKLELKVDTTVVKTVMLYSGSDLSKVTLPEKTGYAFELVDALPEAMPAADLVLQGKFIPNLYRITVSVNDPAMGSVTGQNEDGMYEYNSTARFTAVPAEGYEFSYWEDLGYKAKTLAVKVKGDAEYVAVFQKIESSSSEASSSSVASSSSGDTPESSSSAKSSSSAAGSSSSKTESVVLASAPRFGVSVDHRRLSIWNADIGSDYALLDLQGRIVRSGKVSSKGFELTVPHAGEYLVMVGKTMKRVSVR